MNGPSHVARLPSLRAMFGEHMLKNHEFAAQAMRRAEDGEWVISVLAPTGLHWQVEPDEARAFVQAVDKALSDYRHMRDATPNAARPDTRPLPGALDSPSGRHERAPESGGSESR